MGKAILKNGAYVSARKSARNIKPEVKNVGLVAEKNKSKKKK